MSKLNKNGFSLIELLIVLFIISISYFLLLNKKTLEYKNIDTINNLREELNKIPFDNKLNIICSNNKINKDEYCIYLSDNKKVKFNDKLKNIFNKDLKIYKYTKYQNFEKIKNKRFLYNNEEYDIIYNIEYNKKNIFSPYIISYNNYYYNLEDPIKLKEYKTLQEILKKKSLINEF